MNDSPQFPELTLSDRLPLQLQHTIESEIQTQTGNLLPLDEITRRTFMALQNKMYPIDPKNFLTECAQLALTDPGAVIAQFPQILNFDWYHPNDRLDPNLVSLLMIVESQGHYQDIIGHIPPQINLTSLTPVESNLLLYLLQTNRQPEVLNRLPQLVDLDLCNDQAIIFLSGLVLYIDTIQRDEFFARLPLEINLTKKDGCAFYLTDALQEKFLPRIIKRLPSIIELTNLSESGKNLLGKLIDGNQEQVILNHLPPQIDLEGLNDHAVRFLLILNSKLNTREIIARLPRKVNLSSLSKPAARLLFYFFDDNLLHLLPKELDLGNISPGGQDFLRRLAGIGYNREIIDRLSPTFDLTKLNQEAQLFYVTLLPPNDLTKVVDQLLQTINIKTLSPSESNFLSELLQMGYGQELISWLPQPVNIFDICPEGVPILEELIFLGHMDLLLDHMPTKTELISTLYSRELKNLLIIIIKQNVGNDQLKKLLSNSKESLRQPVKPEQLSTVEAAGPYLFEIIEKFPIIPTSVTELNHGWYRAQLQKNHSESYIFINIAGEEPKILFRTDDIRKTNLAVYKKSAKILPGFISGPRYLELDETPKSKHLTRLYPQGFREVFAGSTLESINLDALPKLLQHDILAQKNYILLQLTLNNIEHGHIHDQNFNVRFLLTSTEGQKKVVFDINYAIQFAKLHSMTLTPIVTLRDWDQGEIV